MKQSKIFAYLMISFGAIIYNIGIQAFLQEAKIFPTGLGAFVTIITYSADHLKKYYAPIYLLFNIPLIIIFWKKVKRQFIYKTFTFLLIQAAFGSLFMIDSISGVFGSIFDNFKPFRTNEPNGKNATGWPIIMMAVLASGLSGFGIAISWKYGGSSGGTDIITYYFSTKKKKSIGKVTMVIGVIIAIFSFGITMVLDERMIDLWYITLLSTFLYIVGVSWIIDWFFPKYTKVKLSIHSEKHKDIKEFLLSSKFPHGFYLKEIESGYIGKKRVVIVSVVLLLEVRQLIKKLKDIDEKIWISVEDIRDVKGNFITKNIE